MAKWCAVWAAVGLLAMVAPAVAHDLPAAELAHLNELVARASAGGWAGALLLVGSGIALGALHGLEPGHAKTMMSAFIIAIRGTVGQAVLLGTAATVSHTAVVWLVVVPVLAWGGAADLTGEEPIFQIGSAAAVLAVAAWTLLRMMREAAPQSAMTGTIDTGHGLARLEIADVDGQPRFCVRGVARSGRAIPFHADVTVRTVRRGGAGETFAFAERDGAQVALQPVARPHEFVAVFRIDHDEHAHEFAVPFGAAELPVEATGEGEHARAHAEALQRRLAGGAPMTAWQIVTFGLGGGLLPCPAAVTVLLLCLQLHRMWLGMLLTGSFSLRLALTMIAAGAAAALGARRIGQRWSGFAAAARPMRYASCALIGAIGLYMLASGIDSLA